MPNLVLCVRMQTHGMLIARCHASDAIRQSKKQSHAPLAAQHIALRLCYQQLNACTAPITCEAFHLLPVATTLYGDVNRRLVVNPQVAAEANSRGKMGLALADMPQQLNEAGRRAFSAVLDLNYRAAGGTHLPLGQVHVLGSMSADQTAHAICAALLLGGADPLPSNHREADLPDYLRVSVIFSLPTAEAGAGCGIELASHEVEGRQA